MNRFRKSILSLSVAAALGGASSAFACVPPQIYDYQSVSPEEAKLPVVTPGVIPPTVAGMCPTDAVPFVFYGLTDIQIAQYLGDGSGSTGSTTTTYPAWSATAVYVAGDSVSYNGKNYRARWWTQGEAPPGASGVWEEIVTATGSNPPAWSSSTAYSGGAQVTYQSNIYKAKWWTQGEVPGTQWSAWELVGPASNNGAGRPANFHASTQSTGGSGTPTRQVSWSTDPFSTNDNPLADNWKVMVDGVVVLQGTDISMSVVDCLPGASPCEVKYIQSGSFTVAAGKTDLMTFWLCKGDVCRMTPRINWYHGGQDPGTVVSPPSPTPTPTPAPTPTPVP